MITPLEAQPRPEERVTSVIVARSKLSKPGADVFSLENRNPYDVGVSLDTILHNGKSGKTRTHRRTITLKKNEKRDFGKDWFGAVEFDRIIGKPMVKRVWLQ